MRFLEKEASAHRKRHFKDYKTTLQEIIANIDYDAAGIIPVVDRQRILRGFLTKSSLLATMSRQFVPEQREGERSGVICATH